MDMIPDSYICLAYTYMAKLNLVKQLACECEKDMRFWAHKFMNSFRNNDQIIASRNITIIRGL